MAHSSKTVQEILLKDLVVRTLVALEGSHTHNLSPNEVLAVLNSVKEEDTNSTQSKLLDAMYEYYADINDDLIYEDELDAMDQYYHDQQEGH